jgi:nicotinamide-nucleotide amidase
MKAEIVSIGTELLLGETLNTNSYFIANELKEIGIDSFFQTTVGDNTKRIHEILEQALERSDIIITTGGLGPTDDDLTHEAIASFFNEKPLKDPKTIKELEKKFYLKGYKKMPANNIKQAYKPRKAKWIPNPLGTAKGIMWGINLKSSANSKLILTFPGVPSEMKLMWQKTIKPYLRKISGGKVIYSKTLKYTGIGESALAEKIKHYFKLKTPTVAPYASIGEVKIRVAATANSIKSAKALTEPVIKKILLKTKKYFFGTDDETLEGLVANLLIKRNISISTAESCTGGLISKRLTDIPGSSKYIRFNAITYSNEAKERVLNVSHKILKNYGAVSNQTAKEMAIGIRKISSTDIGLSVTGIAGPAGGTKTKPIGLVYFGLAIGNRVKTQKVNFGSNSSRSDIRWLSSQFALKWLLDELKH